MTGDRWAAVSQGEPRPSVQQRDAPANHRERLARPLEIERSCGCAQSSSIGGLDRFEAAVLFAIQEAARLRDDPRPEGKLMNRLEIVDR